MTAIQWVQDPSLLGLNHEGAILDWLIKPTILSDAIEQICQASLFVKVISQRFMEAFSDESTMLGIKENDIPLIREVLLMVQNTPLTYGRVIIPSETHEKHFAHHRLDNRLFGQTFLYHNALVKRGAFEYGKMEKTHPIAKTIAHYLDLNNTPLYFARRSLFWMQNDPLMVMDLLLPTLPPYAD